MLVIGNGRLVTRDAENPLIENGVVVMDGTVVDKVGTLEEIRKEFPEAEFIDAKGGVVMPTFTNTHEHIYSAMTRGLSTKDYNPKGFLDTLDGMWWTIDRHLTNEQTRQSARATYLDSIKNGVTTVFDRHVSSGGIHDSLFAIEDAAREMGIRTCLCYEASDRDGTDKAKAAVVENVAWIKHASAGQADMFADMMGMHAQLTISDGTMEPAAVNKPAEVGYHIHVTKGIEDLHDYLKKYGKRIVDRFMDCNILGSRTLLGHCIYVNPHEMELIRDTDIMVVHNPESNMGNVCEYPPTMEIVHRGILTDLGTDGYTHDMTESFRVANALHKHHLCDANAAWGEVPQMLLEGNAKIANRYFKKPLGVLRESAAADVIVMDYIPLTPMDAPNISGYILFGMTGRSVVTTVCNGKVLTKDRELMGMDKEKILYEVREETKRLERSING